jgi:DNA-binding response OmpR family regulator
MKKTLLVIDDEPSICLILEHYFHLDFKVVLKSNGLEAMKWLSQGNQPDAIVADYAMPVMDGFDFIKQLRADAAHQYTPIIILSGKDETTSKISFLKHGADDYVVKPFNPEELELRLKRLLNRVTL